MKVAINGLGRIGRLFFRCAFDHIDLSLINTTRPPEDLAHFLKYDSVHGVWSKDISAQEDSLKIKDKQIFCLQEKHPDLVPWDKYGTDLVFECSGRFKNKKDWEKAFSKGVKKVIVSAPSESADFTLLYGVNHKDYKKNQHHFISNASCTTNCLAPLIFVLKKYFGVHQIFFSTVHSYTNDQRLLDSSHKDMRRSRTAGLNIIPTSTGAGKALSVIFPELKNNLSGLAFRVPTANVSLLDLTVELKKESSLEEVHSAFSKESETDLKGILAMEQAPLVSSDFIGRKESAILDMSLSSIQNKRFLRLSAWYDNELGFSQRMLDFSLNLLF